MGAGVTKVEATANLMTDVLPNECVLFQDRVGEFDPDNNKVKLSNGEVVCYHGYGRNYYLDMLTRIYMQYIYTVSFAVGIKMIFW